MKKSSPISELAEKILSDCRIIASGYSVSETIDIDLKDRLGALLADGYYHVIDGIYEDHAEWISDLEYDASDDCINSAMSGYADEISGLAASYYDDEEDALKDEIKRLISDQVREAVCDKTEIRYNWNGEAGCMIDIGGSLSSGHHGEPSPTVENIRAMYYFGLTLDDVIKHAEPLFDGVAEDYADWIENLNYCASKLGLFPDACRRFGISEKPVDLDAFFKACANAECAELHFDIDVNDVENVFAKLDAVSGNEYCSTMIKVTGYIGSSEAVASTMVPVKAISKGDSYGAGVSGNLSLAYAPVIDLQIACNRGMHDDKIDLRKVLLEYVDKVPFETIARMAGSRNEKLSVAASSVVSETGSNGRLPFGQDRVCSEKIIDMISVSATGLSSVSPDHISELIAMGGDPDFVMGGKCPLGLVISNHGSEFLVEFMINQGASPDGPNGAKERPVITAARKSYVSAVRSLIKAGAKTDGVINELLFKIDERGSYIAYKSLDMVNQVCELRPELINDLHNGKNAIEIGMNVYTELSGTNGNSSVSNLLITMEGMMQRYAGHISGEKIKAISERRDVPQIASLAMAEVMRREEIPAVNKRRPAVSAL